MLKKFKLEALTPRHRNGKTYSVWTTYVVEAHDPFDAKNKCLVKYPGRHFERISECYPNGNMRIGRSWSSRQLMEKEAEIMIMYDLGIEK